MNRSGADHFKCLISAQGLVSASHNEIKLRELSKFESESDPTLKRILEDCQMVVSVRSDSKNIDKSGIAYVRKEV